MKTEENNNAPGVLPATLHPTLTNAMISQFVACWLSNIGSETREAKVFALMGFTGLGIRDAGLAFRQYELYGSTALRGLLAACRALGAELTTEYISNKYTAAVPQTVPEQVTDAYLNVLELTAP